MQVCHKLQSVGKKGKIDILHRQGIGRLIIHETDNFVKTVAGKLIAIANEGGMETTALWPNDVAPGLYRNFPAWPKYPEEWPENFAVWLHDLKVEFPGPDRYVTIYYLWKLTQLRKVTELAKCRLLTRSATANTNKAEKVRK